MDFVPFLLIFSKVSNAFVLKSFWSALPSRTPVATRVLCVRVVAAAATGHMVQNGAGAAEKQNFFKFNFNELKFKSPPWWMVATSRDSAELLPVKNAQ